MSARLFPENLSSIRSVVLEELMENNPIQTGTAELIVELDKLLVEITS